MTIKAYAAQEAGGKLEPFEYDPGALGDEQVEIAVEYCGICHSDLSMLDNEWQMSEYPLVPGHEVVGKITAVGDRVQHLQVGQTVGLGWFSNSCMSCEWCNTGDKNLCPDGEGTIVGRHGGFADKVRAHAGWVLPLPDNIDPAKAGPLFCGGITVFNPIVQFNVKPTDRVAVIGIGGLGHLAIQFLSAWGCDVTVFSTSPDKEAEARELGASHFINAKEEGALAAVASSFDFIISTVSADLDWMAYIEALRPKGRLHVVGAAPNPLEIGIFPLLLGQKQISSSPVGSPSTISQMLDFTARHGIETMTEMFPMSEVNEAMEHLRNGKPRYRIVLER
ncbi:MAG: NAD(P)-dependent alcohol dehydrogenase [Jaaginema sp. PMC 1079.18]|nr:NAD(P)-dependent alcohol dehydrogenase [Jaaginema sp. PMC 1080.18]MEC4851160.1 NAD(P)-dependent alcohol dehydrogenase [Jaaginema sp. PMC 1079.18]MEC4867045.1 NAD(P)-dependent alcohol dehydrogenase [Jaaginema sp. PMC 1078.18]